MREPVRDSARLEHILEAIERVERYSADKALQQKAEGNGWTLHKLAVVFRGRECKVCEEVQRPISDPYN